MSSKISAEVVIIGSGPIGATFARHLVENGKSVILVDAGPQRSPQPGEHLKNAYLYQKDRTNFSQIVNSELYKLSIPTSNVKLPNLDPSAYWAAGAVRNNMNPKQNPNTNMPYAQAAFAVGGMGIHWTCATPRLHPELERWHYITEWDELYAQAEKYFNTHTNVFERSLRGAAIKRRLEAHYNNQLDANYPIQNLPVAAQRREDGEGEAFIHWTGPYDILKPVLTTEENLPNPNIRVLSNHIVQKLHHKGGKVEYAEVQSTEPWEKVEIYADIFIVAAAAIKTPQLLWNSDIRPQALGRYLSEHIMTFGQIVLSKEIVAEIKAEEKSYFKGYSKMFHVAGKQKDPIDIPLYDPDPTLWIPVQKNRQWHCQIHKDNFSYGIVPDNIDDRLVVDLRWFGFVDQIPTNYVTFEEDIFDIHGMPQPTFHFQYPEQDAENAHRMMEDMTEVGLSIGGFLPTPEARPQFMAPGSSLHSMGTYRMGENDDGTSVVDSHSQVWGFDNLYLGGPGVIPKPNGANPTLTAAALAIRAANHILRN